MPRRILILNERDLENPLMGGAEVNLFEIFGELAKRGHQVTLLCASFPGCEAETTIRGIRVRRLANRYAFYPLVPFVARREIRRAGCDVVVDVLAKLPFFSPWFQRVPCLSFTHHLFGTTAFRQVSFPVALVSWSLELLIPWAYKGSPGVVVSPSTKQDLVDRGLSQRLLRVVPNGVDPDVYRAEPSLRAAHPLVLWVGRLEPYKRVDVLLRAMRALLAELPDARLAVVGGGGHEAAMRQLASELGIERAVEFTGFVSQTEKVRWMQRAHVLVNGSEKEGWGLTVIEGNACGTPTIASDAPGLRDSVVHGRTGVLVPHADVAELSKALLEVLQNADKRDALVRGALDWARRFRWKSAADDVESIIDAVAEERPVRDLQLASVFADR